jgi:hypothetical protein
MSCNSRLVVILKLWRSSILLLIVGAEFNKLGLWISFELNLALIPEEGPVLFTFRGYLSLKIHKSFKASRMIKCSGLAKCDFFIGLHSLTEEDYFGLGSILLISVNNKSLFSNAASSGDYYTCGFYTSRRHI